jgi:hypothetical protein
MKRNEPHMTAATGYFDSDVTVGAWREGLSGNVATALKQAEDAGGNASSRDKTILALASILDGYDKILHELNFEDTRTPDQKRKAQEERNAQAQPGGKFAADATTTPSDIPDGTHPEPPYPGQLNVPNPSATDNRGMVEYQEDEKPEENATVQPEVERNVGADVPQDTAPATKADVDAAAERNSGVVGKQSKSVQSDSRGRKRG